MPRKYTWKPGSRSYKNYTSKNLLKAVEETNSNFIYATAKKYTIPYGTLHIKVKDAMINQLSHEIEFDLAKVRHSCRLENTYWKIRDTNYR